jgi:hypothetical protein
MRLANAFLMSLEMSERQRMTEERVEMVGQDRFETDAAGVRRLHPDWAASAALMFLPAGELQNKLIELEGQYERFMWKRPGKKTLRARFAWWIAGPALRIIRTEVAELAKANQQLLLDVQARPIAQNFGAEYQRMCADLRTFRKFLLVQFEKEMDVAEARNTPLLDVAKELILRGR